MIAAGSGIVLVIVFAAGVFVGLDKARFSSRFGQNYVRNFGGSQRFISDRDFMNAHGSAGQIIKIEGNIITVKNQGGAEKNIIADSQTTIEKMRQQIKLGDLKVDDFVVAIGKPDNQGQIQAKLIRVLPSPLTAQP